MKSCNEGLWHVRGDNVCNDDLVIVTIPKRSESLMGKQAYAEQRNKDAANLRLAASAPRLFQSLRKICQAIGHLRTGPLNELATEAREILAKTDVYIPGDVQPEIVNEDVWGESEQYPVADWVQEVQNGDTRSGYRDWVIAKAESDNFDANLSSQTLGVKS